MNLRKKILAACAGLGIATAVFVGGVAPVKSRRVVEFCVG